MITSPSSHANMIFHLPVVSRNHHHDDGNDDDEEEETLSLCEYSINSSSDSQNSSFKSLSTEGGDDEDSSCFEFCSQEWSTTDDRHKSLSSTSSNYTIIFCGKLIPSKEPIPQNIQEREREKIESEPTSSKQNLPPLFASSTPSKCYLFFFGIRKLRTKMEVIGDIKVRQSRSRRSSSFRSIIIDEEMRSTCMAKNKDGFWAVLLRTLSCGSVPTIVG